LSLCFKLHAFSTPVQDGIDSSISRYDRFTPGTRAAAVHWMGGSVNPRAGLNVVAGVKVPVRAGNHVSCHE